MGCQVICDQKHVTFVMGIQTTVLTQQFENRLCLQEKVIMRNEL